MSILVGRVRGRPLAIAFAVVSFTAAAVAGLQERAGFLWIAQSGGLLNVATDAAEVRFEIQTTLGTTAVGVNDYSGEVWAYGNRRLLGFDRDGTQRVAVDTPVPIHGGDPADLLVDGAAGVLWLPIKRDLYRYDLRGQLQQTLLLPRNIIATTLDRDRSTLWVAQEQQLRLYEADGTLRKTVDFPLTEKILDIAYDRRRGEVWLVMPDRLRRYDADATRLWESRGNYTGAIAPDGAGGLWQARDAVLLHRDPEGALQSSIEPFAGQADKAIVDLVADPHDASVWVASRRSIAHHAVDGEQIALLRDVGDGVFGRLSRGALYADLDPPEVTITAPPADSLVATNRPAIELSYFDLGVGVDPDSIRLTSAGAVLAATCTATATTARCVPAAPLPEGASAIRVTVADRMMNVSEPVERRVIVDTVPPAIRIDSPAADAVTNQPTMIVRGSLSEPGTLSFDGTTVALDSAHSFSVTRQLREGSNAFALLATDRAGNSSAHTVRVVLDTVAPAALAPASVQVSERQGGLLRITGVAGAVEPGSRIRIVNVRTGKVVEVSAAPDGSFVGEIEGGAVDELSITVLDVAGNASTATSAKAPAASGITIIEPAEGAVVPGPSVVVTGKVTGLNASVSVNGIAATLLAEGSGLRFYADVPLAIGSNTISATATFHDRPGASAARSVTRTPGTFMIQPSALVGNAALTVTYQISEASGAGEFYRIVADLDGDGSFEQSFGQTGTGTLMRTYQAGTHHPKIEIRRWDYALSQYVTIYQEAFTVVAVSSAQTAALDRGMIQALWQGLIVAMNAADREKALLAFSEPARVRYGAILGALEGKLPQIAGDLSHPELILLRSQGHASYVVMTSKDGVRSTFVVSFLKDRHGLWRIESM